MLTLEILRKDSHKEENKNDLQPYHSKMKWVLNILDITF